MSRKWREWLVKVFSPPHPRVPCPERDPDHDEKIAEARAQVRESQWQLDEVKRLEEPLNAAAEELARRASRNHVSESLEQILRDGYVSHRARSEGGR